MGLFIAKCQPWMFPDLTCPLVCTSVLLAPECKSPASRRGRSGLLRPFSCVPGPPKPSPRSGAEGSVGPWPRVLSCSCFPIGREHAAWLCRLQLVPVFGREAADPDGSLVVCASESTPGHGPPRGLHTRRGPHCQCGPLPWYLPGEGKDDTGAQGRSSGWGSHSRAGAAKERPPDQCSQVFYLVIKVSGSEPWASSSRTQRVLGARQLLAQVPSVPRPRHLTWELPCAL